MSHNHAFGLNAYEKILRECLAGSFVRVVKLLEWITVGHGISEMLTAIIAKEKICDKRLMEQYTTRALTEIAPGVHVYWIKSLFEKMLEKGKKEDTSTLIANDIVLGGVPNHRHITCPDCYEVVLGSLEYFNLLDEELKSMVINAGGQFDIILRSDNSALTQQIISLIEIIKMVPARKDGLDVPHSEINQVGSYFEVMRQLDELIEQGKEDEAKKLCRHAICKHRFEKCVSEIEKVLIYQEEILLSEINFFSDIEEQKKRYKNVLDKKMNARQAKEMIKMLFDQKDLIALTGAR